VSLIVLPSGFLTCQAGDFQSPQMVLHDPPGVAEQPNPTPLVLELDRAIVVLKQGLKENWATRDKYLSAFERTPNIDRTGRLLTDEKKFVECAMNAHLRTHEIWDEGPPIGVEVHRTIVEFAKQRDEAIQGEIVETQMSPCAVPAQPKVVLSAGVAMGLLKIKDHPVTPAGSPQNHVSGMVVLRATISAKGSVEALRVISGPVSLQQAALDIVRQWTYRPYLLNNRPVEFETTIKIDFAPNR
jgi:TonB family protein